MRVLGAMIIIPVFIGMFISFIILNIFVFIIGIIALVLLIKNLKTKKKSIVQKIINIIFVISATILGFMWSIYICPEFYGKILSTVKNGKEVTSIICQDTDDLEKYLSNGWMVNYEDNEFVEDLIYKTYSNYYDNLEECEKADEKNIEILDLLLEYGYDPNLILGNEDKKYTLLSIAIGDANYPAVEVLVEHGADINDLKYEKGTVLHRLDFYTLYGIDLDLLKLFIREGVDVHKENEEGITGIDHLKNCLTKLNYAYEREDLTTEDKEKLKEINDIILNMK